MPPLAESGIAHQHTGIPDWEHVKPEERTFVQQLAAESNGWVTPPNVVSILGGIATGVGIYHIGQGNYGKGLAWVIAGRGADLADGWLAHRLGVRSEKGAFVDTAIDKAVTVFGTIALTRAGVLRGEHTADILLDQLQIMQVNHQIHQKGADPNPSRAGKKAMAYNWAYVFGSIEQHRTKEQGGVRHWTVRGLTYYARQRARYLSRKAIEGYQEQNTRLDMQSA